MCVPLLWICTEMFSWWGKVWPMVACPFRALVVQYQTLSIFTWYGMFYVWATASTFFYLLMMFLTTDFFLETNKQTKQNKTKNRFNWLPSTSFIAYLLTKLLIIGRSVSGIATDSPCDVWGRGWTTCLLCSGPIIFIHLRCPSFIY